MSKTPVALEVRFWSRVDKSGGPNACWLWTGTIGHNGYGRISRGLRTGKDAYAHRIAWELTFGLIPDGLLACHHCDNPPCCNPAHLFLGTNSDNMSDCAQKGRNVAQAHPEKLPRGDKNGARLHIERMPRGERNGFAKLTEATVRAIRDETPRLSQREIARKYGICQASVGRFFAVRRGRTLSRVILHFRQRRHYS